VKFCYGFYLIGNYRISFGHSRAEVEVTLRLTVSHYDLVLSPLWDLWPDITSCRKVAVWKLQSCFCGAPSLTRGQVCSLQCTQWSESRRTRNRALLSHLRLPQPGGPGSRIYISQEQGGPVIPLGTRFFGHMSVQRTLPYIKIKSKLIIFNKEKTLWHVAKYLGFITVCVKRFLAWFKFDETSLWMNTLVPFFCISFINCILMAIIHLWQYTCVVAAVN
jgi:hypothetical protein